MKLKYLILIFSSICFSQNKVMGVYKDSFGNKLQLFENNDFKHTWHFDLAASWTIGKWKISNDTLKLETIKVYDTLTIIDKKTNFTKDSLVLSSDEFPKRITTIQNAVNSLSSGGQNRILPNLIFLIKNKKLIIIKENGKLQTEKITCLWDSRKKAQTWYIKQDE